MRLQSNAAVREILTTGSLSALLDGTTATACLVVLLVIVPPLGLLVLGLGAAQAVVTIGVRRRNQRLTAASLEAGGVRRVTPTVLPAWRTSRRPAPRTTRWRAGAACSPREISVSLDRGRLNALVKSGTAALELFSPLALLAAGALLVLQGGLSLGTMLGLTVLGAAFLEPLAALVTPASSFSCSAATWPGSTTCSTRRPSSRVGHRRARRLRGHIEAEGLSFRYGALRPLAVDNVSVQVRPASSSRS